MRDFAAIDFETANNERTSITRSVMVTSALLLHCFFGSSITMVSSIARMVQNDYQIIRW